MRQNGREAKLRVLRRALLVACCVGPSLTLINQFDAILGTSPFSVLKLCLTMVVPFCVATFSGLTALSGFQKTLAAAEVNFSHEKARLIDEHAAAIQAIETERDVAIGRIAELEKRSATRGPEPPKANTSTGEGPVEGPGLRAIVSN